MIMIKCDNFVTWVFLAEEERDGKDKEEEPKKALFHHSFDPGT